LTFISDIPSWRARSLFAPSSTEDTTMRLTRRGTRDQLTKPRVEHPPDGIGGTIAGAPMERIGLLNFLEHGAYGASRGGAVSGAAQVVSGWPTHACQTERSIALSDGSRICFASLAGANQLPADDEPIPPVANDSKTSVPKNGKPRATAVRRPGANRRHRSLAFV
jgi:hypothetical protein